ncbi:ulp1 protease family, C-terminal catalytic domain-containing protein [Artemisia annua]|uniref:Ulp1 protease family, C-terminal catalytic domain-containing protein n=1 Tax=Artemisia annua TaxID=35608 RepID=A0A2U1QBA3_ARTAN|nr:ulp1 protease family, C-terminal catalytic domain-containing protein [Artemisia annua]
MGNDAGGSSVTIDLTSDPENVDVPGTGINGGNERSQPRNVQGGDDGLAKKDVGKGKLCLNKKSRKKGLVDEEKEHEEDVDNDVGVKKRTRKSKMDGEAVAKNKGENGVGCKVPDVDRIHQRISLWSLHRLLPKLSTKQKQDVTEIGIKDIPTRLSYRLLDNFDEDRCVLNVDGKEISITRETVRDVHGIPMGNVPMEAVDKADFRHPLIVEWKQQFDSTTRYKHIPVEKQIYTQQEGGWMFKLNFLVLYFTSIGEANKNATVNLRFFNCIQDENDIPGFDWCSYVIECLVRTKRSWVRTYHYCGPVIVLLVVYDESMCQIRGNEDVEMPLVNNWTVDMFNKLEEERLSPKNVEDRCVLTVDGKEISITRETVRDVLGIPMGNVPVESVDEADFRHPLIVEWKQQIDSTTRYKHIPVEKQIYTQQEGGWMFKLNFLVLYFTSIGEANKNATVNLRFFNCIQDENDIPGFDWCSYVIECLVRPKRSWVRTYHYCGPVIVLLVVYDESMRQSRGNGDVEMPLVNNWIVDMFNKLEEERLSPKNVEVSPNIVEEWSFKDAPDEPFPFTQFYGTPSTYVAYSEQVSAERRNKEKSLRSDKVNVSKFDLNITQPPATQGRSVDVSGGDKSFVEAEELLESLQVYDSQDLPHFDCFTPEKLIVGRQESGVSGDVSNGAITPYTICDEAPLQTIIPKDTYVRPKRYGRPAEVLCSPDILFQTDYAYAPRIVFESLCPRIRISSEAVDMFTKVLNDSDRLRDPKKLTCKVFCDTSLMRQWDVKDLKGKKLDVKESSDKFIKGMRGILESTVYGTLANVDFVFFPICQGGHFYVVCVHLKRKEVHILDNMLSLDEDASERYGGLVDFLVARFEDFLSCENHPAQGFLRYADRMILRLGCMTKNNDIDCGVFAMRHMETYLFGGEYDDLCGLRREGKDQQHQLDDLRKKYAAKILLTDINKKKADFKNEELTYKLLPLAQRQRLEAASYERCFARVTQML